tara:strand:- start:132 stop:842 length:711 start_codon:yes stop_codon:yes gene_type:complete
METATQIPAVVGREITIPRQNVTPSTLASILKDKGDVHSFVVFDAKYDMLVTDKRGQLSKMKKRGNPFLSKGLWKYATTQVTVNWKSSQEKTESRGGEWSGRGTWHTVVIIGGKVTPLSVHKDDIETFLPDDAERDNIFARRAVVKDGLLVYKTEHPQFYLRYEVVRGAKKDATCRAERPMRSKSVYQLSDNTFVDKKEVEPWLKPKSRKDETDIQVTCLSNLLYLQIDGQVFDII